MSTEEVLQALTRYTKETNDSERQTATKLGVNCMTLSANIYDTAEKRLVWEDEFESEENARIAMYVEQLLLARLPARPRHVQ